MSFRSFLSRLCLAALGLMLICLGGFIGLGWLVREPSTWFSRLLGEDRCDRLRGTYVRTLGTLLPADSDGDGFADSVERYLQYDPHDGMVHPPTALVLDEPGFAAIDLEIHREGPAFVLQPGEHRRIRGRLCVEDDPAVFARGVRWSLQPESPSLLCLPGGTPSAEPLLIPMGADGAIEFELRVRDDAVPSGLTDSIAITVTNPVSGQRVGGLDYSIAWRLPPIPCTMHELPKNAETLGAEEGDWHAVDGKRLARLTWQSEEPSGLYYIEATRDETGRKWFPIGICNATDREWRFAYELRDSKDGPHGPLKFRVIPTKPVPREE